MLNKPPKEKEKINYAKDMFLSLTSNKAKIFSSKKTYVFVAFVTMLTITLIYIAKNINKIAPLEFIEVVGMWLAYGGYNSYQNYRDRKLPGFKDQVDKDPGESSSDPK